MKHVEELLFSILMSVVMSLPISFVMTIINVGMNENIFQVFISSGVIGTIVSIPVAFLAVPLIKKLVGIIISRKIG